MKTRKLFYRVLTVVILCAMVLPWSSGSLSGTAHAACPVTAENWHEVGADSACAGGISNNSGRSYNPSLAIAPDGTPYVAWEDMSSGAAEIYIRRWNGSGWEEVGSGSAIGGGISNNSGAWYPSVAIAPDGTPYVAWNGWGGGAKEIYIRRWNGSGWEEVGSGSATGGGISNNSGYSEGPSVAVAPDGTPYVAWEDDSCGDYEIYIRRWNGSGWEEVGSGSATGGGISNNSDRSWYPSVAVAPDGTPYVAWEDDSCGDYEIYVRRWNGSSWEEVGAGSASGGGISNNSGGSRFPSVAIAPDGTPYVAWDDSSAGSWAIYIRRWNGSSWEEVGAGSASGGGISNNSGGSRFPSVAIAPDGTPYVAWAGDSGGNLEIHVRRWSGSRWTEVGSGSATGGGISNNSGLSGTPSVAIAPDGTPYVAWCDNSGGDSEIYVRQGQREIIGKVTDGHGHSLSGVFVGLLKDAEGSYAMTTTTNAEGNYTLANVPPATTYKVRVILRDGSNATQIHWGTNGLLVSAQTQPFSVSGGQTVTKNIDFGDASLDSAPIPVGDLDDLAVMFYHSQQVNDFVRSTLGESDFQPTGSIWGFSPNAGVFYEPGQQEVNIDASSSQWDDPNRPMNREWHENFHHLMNVTVGMPPFAGGEYNHRGFNNPSSDDSWAEGWAELWPCVLWDHLNLPSPHLYRIGSVKDFEFNWKSWQYEGSYSREEFAIASLLWDLYDPLNPSENDYLDLATGQIWNVIGSTTYNDLSDMKDVYDAFIAAGIGSGDSDGDGLSDLDELFVSHGIFADTNGNHSHDAGEEIGRAADSSRPSRRNTPDDPNAYLLINVEDGNPLNASTLIVSVKYDPPNHIYDYSYEVDLTQGTGNMVPFSLPPIDAPSMAEIAVKRCGRTSEAQTIDNATYWAEVASSTTGYAEELTFAVGDCIYLPIILKTY